MLLWSDDSGDSTGANLESQKGVMDGVIQSFPAPRLVLQHSTVNTSESSSSFRRDKQRGEILMIAPAVVNYAVPKLQEKGYQLVTVNTCLGDSGSPYQYVGEPGQQDGSWTC
jgi:hypothetical protein